MCARSCSWPGILDRPILPVILEPVEFSDAMAYFLQGRQWIDASSQSVSEWLAELTAAVARFGVRRKRALLPLPKLARSISPCRPVR